MDSSNWITALYAGGSAVLCAFAYEMLRVKTVQKSGDTINEVLFYGGEDTKDKCKCFNTVTRIICQAKCSIDVCVPRLNNTIKKCLLMQSNAAINIRVIVYNWDSYEDLLPLTERGVVVKVYKSLPRMEYEFILIDGGGRNGVVMAGSLDHDSALMIGTTSYVIVTSDKTAVKNFNDEFNRIWDTVAITSGK